MRAMDDEVLARRYLARLGLDVEPPSAEALSRLHRAHVERVSWETLWIQCGETWGTDPVESARRIATTGRGGYCFHLNGAFSWLLAALGYDVRRHAGGVHGPEGPSAEDLTNHLVLTVHALATDSNPEGDWYVDTGLGDAIHEPLPLNEHDHTSGPFAFRLTATPDAVTDWHLDHHLGGAFTGMAWCDAPASMTDFTTTHTYLSTDPGSRFVQFLVLSRRDADGADLLRGLAYQRSGGGATRTTIGSEVELFALLGDVFGVDVAGVPSATRRAVWNRTDAAHQAFLAARAGGQN